MSRLYTKDSTNPYGFGGALGTGVAKHVVSRWDRMTPSERNYLEQVVTELRNELTVQIDDSTSLRQEITYKVFVPETRTNVVNSTYIPFEFRGNGLYEPVNSLDGPVVLRYDGYLNRVIVHRTTPGTDGTTVIDVKVDATSVLTTPIAVNYTDTTAIVVDSFSRTFFGAGLALTVDVVDAETDAEDLLVVVEVAYPFKSDIFVGEFIQDSVPLVQENIDGIWVCPFEADWKYAGAINDTTADSGMYSLTVHRIDATEAYTTGVPAPGYGGFSLMPGIRVVPGEKFAVSVDTVPVTSDPMNLRVTLMFDRRTLDYKSAASFIAAGQYSTATAWDVPRYFPDTVTLTDVYLTRVGAGTDGSTVIALKDDGVEIVRMAIDSSTSVYDGTCHATPNISISGGSYLTFDILEIESGSPYDLRCEIIYEKSIPTNVTSFADSTETAEARSSITRLDSTVMEVTSLLLSIDSTVYNLHNTLTAVDSTVYAAMTGISRLDSTVSEVTARLAVVDATAQAAFANVAALTPSLAAINVYLASVDSTMSQIASRVSALDTSAAQISASIEDSVSFSFSSPAAASGTYYAGGYYKLATPHSNFNSPTTFGTANVSHPAYFFVVLGEITSNTLTINVSGTSVTEAGVRTGSDSENIVIPTGAAINSYYQTTKRWLGQVTVLKTGGSAKNCNYGLASYWHNHDRDFWLDSVEVFGQAGASDTNPNFKLIVHDSTSWTFNLGATATKAAYSSMQSDHSTEKRLASGEGFGWMHSGLNKRVYGSNHEGLLLEFVTTVNAAIQYGTVRFGVRNY